LKPQFRKRESYSALLIQQCYTPPLELWYISSGHSNSLAYLFPSYHLDCFLVWRYSTLSAQLIQAPVSYIIGIDRKYERLELPTDDFLLCDLDQDSILASTTPMVLPTAIRQKLAHLLSVAAQLHLNRGVPIGPPAYIQECYPKNCFTIDRELIASKHQPPGYGKFVGLRSLSFEDGSVETPVESPIFNAFQHSMRQEEKELEQFLYGSTNIGTDKSFDSFPSFDPAKYASINSRPSSSTLRDFTAHLRHPSYRGSGLWNNRNANRHVYPVGCFSNMCRLIHLLYLLRNHLFSLEKDFRIPLL
jgi:hypothetical protein